MGVRLKRYFGKDESGQVLIQVAVMLVVLLGFAALAIDVGNVYAERRQMQNAADAGALAGARAMCLLESNDVITAEAKKLMKDNGVATVADEDVQIASNYVNTKAQTTAKTFLAGIIGFDTIDVQAEASAACGAATSACGLWPITFDYGLWKDELNCGEKVVIWDGENDQKKEDVENLCVIDDEPRPICDCYKCDLDDDGTDDFRIVTGVSRGWVDYTGVVEEPYEDICGSGCNANDLYCRFLNDSAARVSANTCVPGIPGTKWNIKKAVDKRAATKDVVSIPLFDTIGCTADEGCAAQSVDTYHIAKFGCVTIEASLKDSDFVLEPRPEYEDSQKKNVPNIRSKVIIVSVNCSKACFSSCGGTDGTLPKDWEVRAVSLMK